MDNDSYKRLVRDILNTITSTVEFLNGPYEAPTREQVKGWKERLDRLENGDLRW